MTLRTALRLGRASNLPTVWTNAMAGSALAGGELRPAVVVPLALALSLFYVAGMYLNDAFDARWDMRHRRERPIPSGEVGARTVFAAGFGMLGLGLLLLGLIGGSHAVLGGLALAGLIVLYDAIHKKTALAPVIMGACRAAAYVVAALVVVAPPLPVRLWVGAALLLLYIVVLSAIAKRESVDPRAMALVGRLIAGISILDGMLLALTGHFIAAGLAVGAYFQTRAWQRHVPGT